MSVADSRRTLVGRETAHRFAQRARAERRRKRRRLALFAGLAAVLAGSVVLVGRSALLRVETVEVTGTRRLPAADVRAAAGVSRGAAMWTLDLHRVRRRVAALPRVRTVSVSRSWPRSVRIAVTERQPVAVAATRAGLQVVVDSGAAEIERVSVAPPSLLRIALTPEALEDSATARRPLITTALAVAVALPAPVRARLALIRVGSLEQVELLLTNGTLVQWGGVDRSERKAAVLTALLVTPRASYDVRAPETPAVR